MSIGVNNNAIESQINDLFSSILIEQQKIDQIKTADPDKTNLTETMLKEFEKVRGRGFFYNYLSSNRGHGPFTELVDGSVKYDLINSIGVNILGHSHPLYIKAHLEAATCDSIMCGNLLPYQQSMEATKKIIETVSNSRLKHFWFAGSGSFANDTALKILWQKSQPKYKIIAFEKAFAGRSVATQDITYSKAYRDGMPQSISVDHVPHYDYKNPKQAIDKTIGALDHLIKKNGNEYCAIMMEIVQGEAGFIYGTKEYYEEVFKWAQKNNLYIWIDEVQSFSRTTELFAFQMFELDKYVDVVTIGKALQTCGTLYTDELNPKPGLVAGTFNGSLVSLNMSSKILRFLTEGNFYGENGKIKQLEKTFINKLKFLKQKNCAGKIGYIGGVGTMISFEIGDSSKELTISFLKQLFNNGIIAFFAGTDPTRVRLLLPLTLSNDHIDEIFQIIEKTINDVVN